MKVMFRFAVVAGPAPIANAAYATRCFSASGSHSTNSRGGIWCAKVIGPDNPLEIWADPALQASSGTQTARTHRFRGSLLDRVTMNGQPTRSIASTSPAVRFLPSHDDVILPNHFNSVGCRNG